MPAVDRNEVAQGNVELTMEDRFHMLLGRLVHSVARLDLYVGLQLRYWGHPEDAKIQELLRPRIARLEERLKALEKLLERAWGASNSKGWQEMDLWFRRAHKARAFRNEYAHGRWAAPGKHRFSESGRISDAAPLLVFVPLDWDMSEDREDQSIEMTLDEFALQVREAEQLSQMHWDLTKRYGGQAYTGHWLSR